MNWTAYKQACDQPDVVSRWMLEQTCELLDAEHADLSDALKKVLRLGKPLPRPADHKGGEATEMFRIELGCNAARRICDCVNAAAAAQIETSGTRGRGLGGFVEAWREYAEATTES
jgi:hypothetical protein